MNNYDLIIVGAGPAGIFTALELLRKSSKTTGPRICLIEKGKPVEKRHCPKDKTGHCVVGKKETIYPLVQTVNALYLQLLEMQKAFTTPNCTPDTLPTSEAIKDLHIEYTNMLTAIIDLLDGAKYLWEGDCHEQ